MLKTDRYHINKNRIFLTIGELVLKQLYCALFGIFLLTIMFVSRFWYPFKNLYPYDFYFVAAVAFQLISLLLKFEEPKEVLIIMLFHIIAVLMELFKTSELIKSWNYPQEFLIGIRTVPLFTGFMYSAVGSYLVRLMKVYEFRFTNYPRVSFTVFVVILIYFNFFMHHFILDIRLGIYALIGILFFKTRVYIKLQNRYYSTFILVLWAIAAFFIWLAENLGSYLGVWKYPYQKNAWQMVGIDKIFAWYLLLIVSFVLITLLYKPKTMQIPIKT